MSLWEVSLWERKLGEEADHTYTTTTRPSLSARGTPVCRRVQSGWCWCRRVEVLLLLHSIQGGIHDYFFFPMLHSMEHTCAASIPSKVSVHQYTHTYLVHKVQRCDIEQTCIIHTCPVLPLLSFRYPFCSQLCGSNCDHSTRQPTNLPSPLAAQTALAAQSAHPAQQGQPTKGMVTLGS